MEKKLQNYQSKLKNFTPLENFYGKQKKNQAWDIKSSIYGSK